LELERLEAYAKYLLTQRRLSPSTINGMLTSLSSFARFLVSKGIIHYNPLGLVPRLNQDGTFKPRRRISPEAVLALRQDVNSETLQVRERLVVELLYAGVTMKELISAEWDGRESADYDTLPVGERVIQLHPEARSALKDYLILRPILCGDFLIVGDGPGYSLPPRFVYNLLQKLSRHIGSRVYLQELRLARFVREDKISTKVAAA